MKRGKVSPGPVPPPTPHHFIPWVEVHGQSAVYGVPVDGDPTAPLLGRNVTSEAACRALCEARADCTMYAGAYGDAHCSLGLG